MRDVTVIIPSYITTEESYLWLKECVASALKQDCQVVVYDDCSKLVPDQLSSEFGNPNNLRIFKGSKHAGVSGARNQAVQHCTTSLILPLDGDDLLVEGAVEKLLNAWQGVPIYPDIAKFGLQEIPHYRLLDFSCDLVQKKLGVSSVNVLHSVEQWRSIGGWNESLDLYEDAEYNSRLMLMYCGTNLHEPLVRYRQHPAQKTRSIKTKNYGVEASRDILNSLRRLQVGCPSCGGKRRSSVQATASVIRTATSIASLPGEQDGRILAQYVGGKGLGAHYYKGVNTHFPYRVVNGQYYYVDPSDAVSSDAPNRRSMFVKVEKPAEQVATPQVEVSRTPVPEIPKTPVVEETPVIETKVVEDLPDIAKMSYGTITNLELSGLDVTALLKREEKGKNRAGVKRYLRKVIGG